MECSIKVVARVKPLLQADAAGSDATERAVQVTSSRDITLKSTSGLFSTRQFRLNGVLDEKASQEDVFEHVAPLLGRLMEGYNCTVFMCECS